MNSIKQLSQLLALVTESKNAKCDMSLFKENIDQITDELIYASKQYYYQNPVISNKEFDERLNILNELEALTGYSRSDSPTKNVGAEVPEEGLSSELSKVTHAYPAISLDKTKDVDALVAEFIKGEDESGLNNGTVLAWKCDGLTLVLTYERGKLIQAATRGNGYVGEDVTHNAPFINGIPLTIPYEGTLIVRGEAMISYAEFDRVNNTLSDNAEEYKNPRNLASGTIRLTNEGHNAKMRGRSVDFFAFKLVKIDDNYISGYTFSSSMNYLKSLGFQVVPFKLCYAKDNLKKEIEKWSSEAVIEAFGFPVDGLVVTLNDSFYAAGLPDTGHHPHHYNGYALKWQDETVETVLRDIEWSASRTGLLNPVAVFDPVELCGTTVSRASVHNVAYLLDKDLRIGDTITVYKANMIIPQIDNNLSSTPERAQIKIAGLGSEMFKIPDKCPVCNGHTSWGLDDNAEIQTLRCTNPDCAAKKIGEIVHMCERDCLNIVGLSEEKIKFLVEHKYIASTPDVFQMAYKASRNGLNSIVNLSGEKLINESGWGELSVKNLVDSISKASTTDFVSFIHALGIPNVGKGQAKLLRNYIENHILELDPSFNFNNQSPLYLVLQTMFDNEFDFTVIDGFGKVVNQSLYEFRDKYIGTANTEPVSYEVKNLYDFLNFTDVLKEKKSESNGLTGLTFVITGSLQHFTNREELIADIELRGGKVSGSVSAKTSYLINNDINSTSGKNKKAMELGIKIISEDSYMKMR